MTSENEEHEKIAYLKKLVDETVEQIESGELDHAAADTLIEETRQKAEELIPDDMDKFDMIYGARFKRLIEQYITSKESSE